MKKLTITVICTILFKLHIERHLKMLDTTSITKVNSKKLNKMEYEEDITMGDVKNVCCTMGCAVEI